MKIFIYSLTTLLIISCAALLYSFKPSADGEVKTIKELKELGADPTCVLLPWGKEQINVVFTGNPTAQKVLLIHGSPGDWTGWSGMLGDSALRADFMMISFDRAGFGETTIGPQEDLKVHGDVAQTVMDQFGPNEKFIVVGHSYGGAVVGQLLADCPEKVERAVFAAPAISPEHQEPRWYNKVARLKIINWAIGKDMRSSNVEMIGLSESLRENEEAWREGPGVPQTFIHGKKDMLVPFQTVDYWKSFNMKEVNYVLRDKMNHFVPWSDPELIMNGIRGIEQE